VEDLKNYSPKFHYVRRDIYDVTPRINFSIEVWKEGRINISVFLFNALKEIKEQKIWEIKNEENIKIPTPSTLKLIILQV